MTLQEKLDQLPATPGVYLMKDVADDVLYVGKATSLRSRVRSYFQSGANLTPRLKLLVASVRDIDFVVADSEAEALVLEFSLIQKHRPRFNVRYRDDKSYPYIRIDLKEESPALCVVRQHAVAKDGARYFGPYPSARDMWETIRLVRRIFRVRESVVASAKRRGGCPWKPEKGNRKRPCLEYHIKRCLGPCVEGLTTKEDYRIAIRQVCALLEGKWGRVLEQLRAEMEQAAESLKYEVAARVRDQIEAIETTLGGQRVVSTKGEEADVLGHALREDAGCVAVLQVRDGRVVGQDHYLLEGVSGVPEAEVLNEFTKHHYQKVALPPRKVLLPVAIEDATAIAELLTSAAAGGRVRLRVPKRGKQRKLVEMALENAAHHLRAVLERESAERRRGEEAVDDLQKALKLPLPPRRIEAFDISNIHGKAAVGSMIVFQGGNPKRSEYRRFRIRLTEEEPNDYAMMHEVLSRRLKAAVSGNVKFMHLPDLMLVDGGPGQLSVALQVMESLGMKAPAAGLAKEHEMVYQPGRKDPMSLPSHSRALHLLQRVRDEAHRFALSYHRTLRARDVRESVLDDVPGIGDKRKQRLLTHFRTLGRLRRASVEEIAAAAGCGRRAAEAVAAALTEAVTTAPTEAVTTAPTEAVTTALTEAVAAAPTEAVAAAPTEAVATAPTEAAT